MNYGGYQPGMYQPGMVPPGMCQPGMCQPGMFPPQGMGMPAEMGSGMGMQPNYRILQIGPGINEMEKRTIESTIFQCASLMGSERPKAIVNNLKQATGCDWTCVCSNASFQVNVGATFVKEGDFLQAIYNNVQYQILKN